MDKLAPLSARAKQNPGVATFRYAGVKVAGTGFQVPLVFRGKTYFVTRAGDAGGFFHQWLARTGATSGRVTQID